MPSKVRHPRRVQARRATNYKAVHRPTRWGNPFPIGDACPRERSMRLYAKWLDEQLAHDPEFLEPLRGYHLGCFCRPDERCHADILIERLYGRG
jgi:hypothetical protein